MSDSQSDDGSWFTLCSKNKASCRTNSKYHTSLHLSDVKQCNSEAGNFRQTALASCDAVSSSAEPCTVVTNLDDDVRWFFEDVSATDDLYHRMSIGDALPVVSAVDKVAEIGLESTSRTHRIVPQTCSKLPLTSDGCIMPTLNVLDKLDKGDSSFYLGQRMSESLVISNGQEFWHCSAPDADKCTSVRSSAEHCTQSICNSMKTSDNNKLLPVQEPQETNKESASTLPHFDPTSSPEGLQLSIPSTALDPSNLDKRSSDSKVSSKNSLRSSRMLCRSRHFRAVQSAMCGLTAAKDDVSNRIKSDDVHNSDLKSSSSLLSQISQDLKNVCASECKQPSELGHVLRQATDRMVNQVSEKSGDREPGYFSRLEQIGMSLSHGNDDLMQLAVEICRHQLALNPSQTWFVII